MKAEDTDRVDYKVYLDYFGFAEKKFGGRYSFMLIIILHVLINVSTSLLSFYLASALSNVDVLGPPKDLAYNLTLIVVECLIVTIIGKLISSIIFM